MAKKRNITIGSLLQGTKNIISPTNKDIPYIPSITEFCESPLYLNLPFKLYPIQRLVLRAFYRGSAGNTSTESMNMTPEEIEICKVQNFDGPNNGNIIEKWHNNEIFTELVLVWGRRSGKNHCTSIMALYEAMRLLECPGGDPYEVYSLGNANPFTILCIANNKEQTKVLFREMLAKFKDAPYFKDKYITDGITNEKICLLTPKDKTTNEELIKRGLSPHQGSVQIETGHSNSNGLVGKGCFVLMLDEAGTYKRSGGPGSDEQIYGNLSPTTKSYVRKEKIYDEKGNFVEEKTHYDGKTISISTPRGMDGVFHRLYATCDEVKNRLMCRAPTWIINPIHTEAKLRSVEQTMTDEKFQMEFGAKFSGTAGQNFFDLEAVEECFTNHNYKLRDYGEPGYAYFAHLDPALSNHNYALALVHKEYYINNETKKTDFNVVLDHMKIWTPQKGKPVNIHEVDEYIIHLNKIFRLSLVTYDTWESQSSIEKLRKTGIPSMKMRYNRYNKMKIYNELEILVNSGRLKLPYFQTLKLEMQNLQRRYSGAGSGYKISPKTEGEVRTDDCIDALAGAVYHSMNTETKRLPQSVLVNTGFIPSANSRNWQTMSGSLGQGTSGQILSRLNEVKSYPK